MTEDQPATLLDRLVSAGISDARKLIESGHVRMVDGIVCDPDTPAPWPTAYVIV